jgi:hypothetical protein
VSALWQSRLRMDENARVSFSIQPFEEVFAVTPVVNEIPLAEMALTFEREQRFEPTGGYGGLIPQWFKYGALDHYFLGEFEPNSYFARMGRVYLLGCGGCGEVGCWPLTARIGTSVESVVWDSFQQTHRPERDYSRFGPFVFEGNQYREAVAAFRVAFSARVPDAE